MIKKVWLKLPVSLRKSLKFLLGNKLYIAAYNKLFTRNNKLLNEDFYEFDYKAVYGDSWKQKYYEIQKDANHEKIDRQFETEENILILCDFLNKEMPEKKLGICHGTRTGKEQLWFNENLSTNSYVFGTDIADDADKYENTIIFDMHKDNKEWLNKFDFVYSNSWDHSYNLKEMLSVWKKHLKKDGYLILNHTPGHTPAGTSKMDPTGCSSEYLIKTLKTLGLETSVLEGVPKNIKLSPWLYVLGKV